MAHPRKLVHRARRARSWAHHARYSGGAEPHGYEPNTMRKRSPWYRSLLSRGPAQHADPAKDPISVPHIDGSAGVRDPSAAYRRTDALTGPECPANGRTIWSGGARHGTARRPLLARDQGVCHPPFPTPPAFRRRKHATQASSPVVRWAGGHTAATAVATSHGDRIELLVAWIGVTWCVAPVALPLSLEARQLF